MEDENIPLVSDLVDTLWNESEQPDFRGHLAPRVKKPIDRDKPLRSIMDVFEQIGGQARFAHWANEHPYHFYTKIYTKLIANQSTVKHTGAVNVVYSPAIPPSPLDGEQNVSTAYESYAHEPAGDSSSDASPAAPSGYATEPQAGDGPGSAQAEDASRSPAGRHPLRLAFSRDESERAGTSEPTDD